MSTLNSSVMARAIALIAYIMGGASQGAFAHDLSKSDVQIYQDNKRVEIWQTSPIAVAREFVGQPTGETPINDAEMDVRGLLAISQGWHVEGQNGRCALSRHAHRRVMDETYLQLRLLFVCDEDNHPEDVILNWLDKMNHQHLVFMQIGQGEHKRGYYVERPHLSYKLHE